MSRPDNFHSTRRGVISLGSVIPVQSSVSIRLGFAAALLPRLFGTEVPGHTTRAPPVGFELAATNGIQLYAIANLDKTSLYLWSWVLLGKAEAQATRKA